MLSVLQNGVNNGIQRKAGDNDQGRAVVTGSSKVRLIEMRRPQWQLRRRRCKDQTTEKSWRGGYAEDKVIDDEAS